jgi:hypothetical protein
MPVVALPLSMTCLGVAADALVISMRRLAVAMVAVVAMGEVYDAAFNCNDGNQRHWHKLQQASHAGPRFESAESQFTNNHLRTTIVNGSSKEQPIC